MSKLTIEERTLLQSLDCKDKEQAILILSEMEMLLPVRSDMFRNVLTLSHKLKNEHIDYAYEMAEESSEIEEDT